ncbi:MAG: ATP-binding protein [Gammaproteobacteria bacterium]
MAADHESTAEEILCRAPQRVEQSLAEVSGITAAVAEAARIGAWELDPPSGKMRWSKETFRIHEVPPAHPLSLGSALRFFPGTGRNTLEQAIQAAIESGTPFDVTLPFVSARGTRRWLRVLGIAGPSDGGTRPVSGAYQDVTETCRLQERLQRTIRGTQDAVWEQDLETDEVWISDRFRQLLSHDESTLPAAPDLFEQLLHPGDKASFAAERAAHLISEVPFDLEVRLRTRGGAYKWVGVRAAAQGATTGTAATLSGSIRDLTRARADAEALIAAKETAADASRVKSAFLANMSHEIRTPMNGVLGMTELLLDTTLTQTQRELGETIQSSAKSLLRILNDVLDFSKIEAGKLDIEQAPFDLHRCVEDVATILRLQAQQKSIDFRVEIDPATPRHVVGDGNRLRQVLFNLCGNAVKFTTEGGVNVAVFPVAREAPASAIRVEVRDTGIGMSAQSRARIFNPFTQADASITRDFGGTGLGLSIVQRLITLMGGEIDVESEPGRGSVFGVTLPLAASEPPASPATNARPRGRFRGRVLVVEDNEVNQKIVERCLTRLGCEVHIACDGRAGVDAWTREHFDLVLMDVQMPIMDGLTATSEIRRRTGMRPRTPIVALTAGAMTGDLQRCLDAGMDAMLTKPLEVDRLEEALERFGLRVPPGGG